MLRRKHREKNLCDLGLGIGFLAIIPKAKQHKIDKLDLIKIKIFCASKNTIKKMKTVHRMGLNICKSCN